MKNIACIKKSIAMKLFPYLTFKMWATPEFLHANINCIEDVKTGSVEEWCSWNTGQGVKDANERA